ncbi:MAG: iron chelate uptake ABC transporter family permease subunit [Corynebacterium sp.]|nr:iron chelate uptake ABC transporter family permease subunit [Corynebacterium sp.]
MHPQPQLQPEPKKSKKRHLSFTLGSWRLRTERRGFFVGIILVAAIFIAAVVALMLGDYSMTPWQVVRAMFGDRSDPMAYFFVTDLRAPRVVLAILVGAALGVSGAIFQSLTNNPLGSPDITGFTTGAATGALIQILLLDGGPVAVAIGAVVGGLATGLVVYFLSRQQGISGTKFVLVGIGVSFILQGVNSLLVVRADLSAAQTAAQWLAGSFNAATWTEANILMAIIIAVAPLCLILAAPMSAMESGEELATGLGVHVPRRRRELIFLGVFLVAVAVAAAGPIAFVALAAPQLARRLSHSAGVGLLNAAFMGALLVVVSDIVAQRLFAPTQLPVGVITGSLGGLYLIWLLASEWRKKS